MYVIADYRVSDLCLTRLAGMGHVVIRLPCFWGLNEAVCAHPDLLFFPERDRIFARRDYYAENRALLDVLPVSIVPLDLPSVPIYPHDAALDALAIGDRLFGREGVTAPELVGRYRRFVSVKQGYTRCSVAMLTPHAAITQDAGIARSLAANGIEVLFVRAGHIALPGYGCGLIGGAGGWLGEGRYGWFGEIARHPDYRAIAAFAERIGCEMIALEDGMLTDRGGLIAVHEDGTVGGVFGCPVI